MELVLREALAVVETAVEATKKRLTKQKKRIQLLEEIIGQVEDRLTTELSEKDAEIARLRARIVELGGDPDSAE